MKLDVFVAPSASSVTWRAQTIEWDEVINWAKNPASVKECGGYVFGRFKGSVRRTSDLIDRCVLSLDVDIDGADVPEGVLRMGVLALVHDTFTSAPDHVKKRILLPLSRPVTGAEYEVLAETVAQHLGIHRFDRTSFRPAQFMWKPATANRAWYDWLSVDNPPLDPDLWMLKYDKDLAAMSLSGPRRHQKRDPFELGGVVGAFNRAYGHDLTALVEKFGLPYVEEEADRFRYVDSHSVAGMGPVRGAPGLFFSHHATDEAGGQTCSAFDLVRIHRYGHLDAQARPNTPLIKLPSHKAMEDLAVKDDLVRGEQLKEAFGDFADEPLDPTLADTEAPHNENAWRMDLALSKTNKVLNTVENRGLIMENDPIFTNLAYNDMTQTVTTIKPFPWDQRAVRGDDSIGELDDYHIESHLQRVYQLAVTERQLKGMILMAASARRKDPLAEWLRSLSWDGEERLSECLPGVVSTDYTRLAARKSLIGAVARALDPGCQMDYSLILTGREGVGKSRWIRRMATRPEWYGELENIALKDTLLTMTKKWIMVSDEVDAMRRSDFNQLKSFLTKTHDNFRQPYGVQSKLFPRHNVIWGTTNDPKFLRRQEGNRRFLIVECVRPDERCLDDEWVEQVWAEAVTAYLAGETTYMTPAETAVANRAREEFTQDDPLTGQIVAYLDMDVPIEWETMGSDQRRSWYKVDRFIGEGIAKQQVVCAAAIAAEVLDLRGLQKDFEIARINQAIRDIPSWTDAGIQRTELYGPQHCFIRVEESSLVDLI